jgi:hypothetical protein
MAPAPSSDASIFVAGCLPHGTWPHDGPAAPDTVALLLIDMQQDFVAWGLQSSSTLQLNLSHVYR